MLSEWMFRARPAVKIARPARNLGSASHAGPYSPNSEMKRALTYALTALKVKPEADHHNRHFLACSPGAQRVDERPVEIVALPHPEQHQRDSLECGRSCEIHAQEEKRRRKLHDNPAGPVGNVRSPALPGVVPAVWHRNGQKTHERRNGGQEDRPYQYAVELLLSHSPNR